MSILKRILLQFFCLQISSYRRAAPKQTNFDHHNTQAILAFYAQLISAALYSAKRR